MKSKKNMMVAGLVVFLVAYLWYSMIYSSMQGQASKAKDATTQAEARAKTLRTQLNGDDTTKKKPGQPSAADLSAALPNNPAEAQLLRDFDAVFARSGVAWQTVTPGSPTTTGGLASINVGITVAGTYDHLNSYLTGVMALKRLLVVDSVSFGGAATSSSNNGGSNGAGAPNGQQQLQITARVFAQAPAGTVVAGSATTTGASTRAPGAPTPPAPGSTQNG